jgi:predicted nucleic acid-binding protein
MNLSALLDAATLIFLDTAPVIYFVEKNPDFAEKVNLVFERLDRGALRASTSAITLSECLVLPYRLNRPEAAQAFITMLVQNPDVKFVSIDEGIAEKAAELRARYNLSLLDAFQVASAIAAGCDAFLTNDDALKRIPELNIVVLSELDAA